MEILSKTFSKKKNKRLKGRFLDSFIKYFQKTQPSETVLLFSITWSRTHPLDPRLVLSERALMLFSPSQAQLIAQSIGQSFSVAYQEFLRANGIDPEDLSQREYSDLLNTQDMYNDDLIHFSKSENCRDVSQPAGGST